MNPKFFHFLGLAAILQGSPLCFAAPDLVQAIQVHLEAGYQGQLRVLIKGEIAATFTDPNGTPQTFATNSVRVHRVKANEITVDAQASPLVLTMEGFPGWAADLSPKHSTVLSVDLPLKVLEARTPSRNGKPVKIKFSDGAHVDIGPNSKGRFDLFRDSSYAFCGEGLVSTFNADGKSNSLSKYVPPLRGGPLREIIETNGVSRLKRLTPVTSLLLSSGTGGAIKVDLAGQRFELPADTEKELSLTNGSVFQLKNLTQMKMLQCNVKKGDAEVTISALDGWKGILETGEKVTLRWDQKDHIAEISNRGDGSDVILALPDQMFAGIPSGSSLRYASVDNTTFTTLVIGNQAQLYSRRTDRETKLALGTVQTNFIGAAVLLPGGAGEPARNGRTIQVRMEMDHHDAILVYLDDRLAATLPKQEGASPAFVTNSISLRRVKPDELNVETKDYTALVTMPDYPGWQAEMPPRSSSTLLLDYMWKILETRTGPKNQKPVILHLPDSGSVEVSANSSGRYDIFRDGSYAVCGKGTVQGFNAEGLKMKLSRTQPPLRGGPLQESIDTNGAVRVTRLTALTDIKISTGSGGIMELDFAGQHHELQPDKEREFSLTNGTVFKLKNLTQMKMLEFQVKKGDTEVLISAIDGWAGILESRERVLLRWDRTNYWAEIRNEEPESSVLISLPNQTFGAVEANSTFKYTVLDPNRFSTLVTGRDLDLYDLRTGRESKLIADVSRTNLISGIIPTSNVVPLLPLTKRTKSTDLRLDTDSRGRTRIYLGQELVATLDDPTGTALSFRTNSVTIQRFKNGEVSIQPVSTPLVFHVGEFTGWQAVLPALSTTFFGIDQNLRQVDIRTGATNLAPVEVTLPDGGMARLSSSSRGRLAVFNEGTYSFYGDGVVVAVNADGQTNSLLRTLPPLRGGPLRESIDTNGIPRMRRLTPLIELMLTGDVSGAITVDGGGQHVTLRPGIEQEIDFNNGSVLKFDNMAQMKMVKCQVIRGDVEISINEIEGWKAVLQSGQAVTFEWDRSRHLVDLRNLLPGPPAIVSLPSKTFVLIETGSTFQYAYISRNTFATSATGTGVILYDTRTSRETKLTDENLLFVAGIPQGHGFKPTGSESLVMAWDSGAPLELNGLNGSSSISPNSHEVLKYGADKELSVSYNQNGELEIQAIQGNYALRLSALHGMTLNIAMGDSVILALDLKQGTFIVRSGDANGAPISLTTADGFNPDIPPSGALNFNFGKDGSITATSSSGLVLDFSPAGGALAGAGNSIGNGTGTAQNNPLDISRITEVALTTLKPAP